MVKEARLEKENQGLTPRDEGWFVVNAREAQWRESERFGSFVRFESAACKFPELGVNIHIVAPGQAACMYHKETLQEAFLVLSGSCRLLVEGEERMLGAWDFFHCPAGTEHVFVGAGDGPCAILMMGARGEGSGVHYPVSALAAKHEASVSEPTDHPREAYAGVSPPTPCPAPPPFA